VAAANKAWDAVHWDDILNRILGHQEGNTMKRTSLILVFAATMLGACAHPLEQVVDGRHQARIDAANANQPLVHGAADGLGTYIAHDHEAEMQQVRAVNP
jgi:hypothetical protein